jgi:hypothetical protein
MSVRLLYADHHVIATAVRLLGFVNRQIDRLALGVGVPDDSAVVIHNIPAVLRLIVIDMNGVIRTCVSADLPLAAPTKRFGDLLPAVANLLHCFAHGGCLLFGLLRDISNFIILTGSNSGTVLCAASR